MLQQDPRRHQKHLLICTGDMQTLIKTVGTLFMLFSCLIDAGRSANVYTSERTNAKPTLSSKKKKSGARVKNLCTPLRLTRMQTTQHTHTHTPIQAVCKVKGCTQADDNVVFLLRSFYGRCASAVKVEGMHWGLVN